VTLEHEQAGQHQQQRGQYAQGSLYQIVPDSATAQNYTFQICALKSACSYGINWDTAPKYPIEFKSRFYRDSRISSALSFFPDAGGRCESCLVIIVVALCAYYLQNRAY
jgi:hypothetical protein